MIFYYSLSTTQLQEEKKDMPSVCWIHVEDPSDEEVTHLSTSYHLPIDYLTAVLDDAENSRYENHNHNTFDYATLLLLQYPHSIVSPNGYPQYETYPLSIIFTPDKKVITVSKFPPIFFNEVTERHYNQIDGSVEIDITIQLLWKLVTSYNHYLKKIKISLAEIESQIKVSTENKQLYQMLDIQKSLVLIESATKNNLETLEIFSHNPIFEKKAILRNYLQDILIETKQAVTSATIHLRLVDQITDTFSAIVSNNLNNVMKILTSITLVLTIPTIIGGIYGMNVKLPFANSDKAFWLIAVGTIILCISAIRYLRKRNLL